MQVQKEERAHDERIANANYKIKQAGQMYEKNVKRNPADAAEEHSRYITLLSSLGPEITQDKQLVFRDIRVDGHADRSRPAGITHLRSHSGIP